jgi:hypothetical protein
MRLALILVLCLLVSCAERRPIEELEAEAEITGDWSAVDERRRMDRKMGRHIPDEQCGNGFALVCKSKGEEEVCGCISVRDLR